jgi:hypothetical protein
MLEELEVLEVLEELETLEALEALEFEMSDEHKLEMSDDSDEVSGCFAEETKTARVSFFMDFFSESGFRFNDNSFTALFGSGFEFEFFTEGVTDEVIVIVTIIIFLSTFHIFLVVLTRKR